MMRCEKPGGREVEIVEAIGRVVIMEDTARDDHEAGHDDHGDAHDDDDHHDVYDDAHDDDHHHDVYDDAHHHDVPGHLQCPLF